MKINSLLAVLLVIFLTFNSGKCLAQNYVEIGAGTIPNSMPIYSSWNFSWSSLIYTHTDLGTAKTITKIGLNCINGPKTVTNQKIYVKLSPNSVFANANYEDPLNTGYTLVYQGSLTFQNGWNEIILSTPIVYDGTQNLIIHWENRWGSSYGPQFTSTASVINNNKNCGNDSYFPLPSQTGYLNPYPSTLTNMRFYYASTGPATPINPIPADNATVVSVDTDLSWTIGANTTNYDLYFGTNPQNLSLVVADAPCTAGVYSYIIPGLLADSVMHYWKVIAKNGSQQESSPIWKFKTEVVIDQFPYYEGFEDSTVFNTYPVASAWVINPDLSWYEYTANQHSGKLCAKSFASVNGNTAVLRSPKVLLPPGYSISYFWRNTSINKVAGHDTTFFEITVNGGTTWTKLDTLAPNNQNSTYVQRTRDLNAYAGNNFFFRFRHKTDNSGSACNIYVDDISIFQTGATPTLAVTPSNQSVSSPSGVTSFTVTSNSVWSASSNQSWCTVTPSGSGNGTITVNYTENVTGNQRIANITITVAGLSPIVVTVTQGIPANTLSVTPANQNVTSASGSSTFTVTSNTSWTAVSNQTWCTVNPSGTGNGIITANYSANSTGSQRVATITVTASGLTPVDVTVTQGVSGPTLSVTPANQNVSATAGNVNYTVTSNSAWTASSNQSWCTVTANGNGNGNIVATYTSNTSLTARVADITVTVAGLGPVIVTLSQEAGSAYLQVTPGNQDVGFPSGTTNFSISSNTSWTALSDAGWCTVTASGTGNGTLFATYADNTIATVRIAHITITASGLSPVLVTITQQGPLAVLNVSPSVQNVTYQAGVTTFVVTSNANWTASSDASWCQPTLSGTGNGIISATYSLNSSPVFRTANITVSAAGVTSVNLQVIQAPSTVSVEKSDAFDVLIYPNPVKDVINVDFSDIKQNITLLIYNMEGKKITEKEVNSSIMRFDLSDYERGIYLIKIMVGNSCISKKIVVI